MRRSKYRNKKVTYDGITFDSIKEMERYVFLSDLQKKGVIHDLQRQVPFELIPALYGTRQVQLKTKVKNVSYCIYKAEKYFADFTYTRADDKQYIVEDVKGFNKKTGKPFVTREFTIKSKIFQMKFGYPITVVTETNKF